MRLIVDLVATEDHQVEGQLSNEGLRTPMPFSGWLDFVRVLEAVLFAPVVADRGRGG